MNVGHICSRKVDTARPEETAQVAAERMRQRNVGTLVIVDKEGKAAGIVTDRDLALKVVAGGRSARDTWLGEIMTPRPIDIVEDQPIEFAIGVMRQSKCRRLPVVDRSGKLVGIVSLDDVLRHLVEEFGLVEGLLANEMPVATRA